MFAIRVFGPLAMFGLAMLWLASVWWGSWGAPAHVVWCVLFLVGSGWHLGAARARLDRSSADRK